MKIAIPTNPAPVTRKRIFRYCVRINYRDPLAVALRWRKYDYAGAEKVTASQALKEAREGMRFFTRSKREALRQAHFNLRFPSPNLLIETLRIETV